MTSYLTATLQNLLWRSLVDAPVAEPGSRRAEALGATACGPRDALPLGLRSEGFAEDLLDSHPAH